mmetsp:Transcript_25337/g.81316  ORF Transcript_25337/g.81316 Transcript_25337/m.81316 type:complete len:226 (-) Transcript_25337:217-894(-)
MDMDKVDRSGSSALPRPRARAVGGRGQPWGPHGGQLWSEAPTAKPLSGGRARRGRRLRSWRAEDNDPPPARHAHVPWTGGPGAVGAAVAAAARCSLQWRRPGPDPQRRWHGNLAEPSERPPALVARGAASQAVAERLAGWDGVYRRHRRVYLPARYAEEKPAGRWRQCDRALATARARRRHHPALPRLQPTPGDGGGEWWALELGLRSGSGGAGAVVCTGECTLQ